MRVAPDAPIAMAARAPSNTRVGIIELAGRLPGATELGLPSQAWNSRIWLFSRMPVPGTTTPEWLLFEKVMQPALPAASMAHKLVVSVDSAEGFRSEERVGGQGGACRLR